MKGILRKLGFSLVPVVIIGTAAEVGLRSAGWPQITGAFEHNTPFWVTDPDLKQKPFPHKEESRTFKVSSNEDGLRAAASRQAKTPGVQRLMLMGCSTTFGWGVGDDETYPARLAERIRAGGHGGIEVLNAGQPGYTSFQGRWLWERTLRHYKPDVVLLGFVVQDARKAAYTDKSQAVLQGDHRFMKDNVLYKSRVYLALRSVLGGLQLKAKERPEGGKGGIYRVPPADFVDNIRAMVSSIQATGSIPVLFGFPLERSGYTSDHRKILKAAAAELDIPYLDLQAQMEQASRESTLYFANDRGHANAAGNAQIATWVYAFLIDKGLIGGTE
jgi:lysophospholipase L1-like esterase